MQLYFIRHAQSENNELYARTGSREGRSEDPDLTAVGRRQAQLLARFLSQGDPSAVTIAHDPQNAAGFGITHIYCSLMVRAVATGMVIAEALNLPLVGWEDLHEIGGIVQYDENAGEPMGLPGRNRAYFETHYPDLRLPESVGPQGWWNRPFEEHEERVPRAQGVLGDLVERHGHTEDQVALVSHGGFYNYLLTAILDCPRTKERRKERWFILNNAAITRIDFDARGIWLVYMNRADFLPRELIT
jgi:2,3-bisphosphoglycerate-dependent phosphoglycerate mutase